MRFATRSLFLLLAQQQPPSFVSRFWANRATAATSSSSSSVFASAFSINNGSVPQPQSQQQHRLYSETSTALHASDNDDNTNNNMSDEVTKAQTASDDGEPTVFDKILSGEWDSTKVYDDDQCYAFKDISPQAPFHAILIPKQRDGLTQLSKARSDQEGILGHLLYVASQIGKEHCPDGFRIVVNDGKEGAQSVYHLHLHVLGGRQLNWPPG